MNGFLVIGRCGMDDVPLGLYVLEAEAESAANHCTEDGIIGVAFVVLGVKTSHVIGVDVVQFSCGLPMRRRSIHRF